MQREATEKCDMCDKVYQAKKDLKRHEFIEHGIDNGYTPENYQCDQCDKNFTAIGNLNKHVETVHKGIRKFSCEECGKAFISANDMERHKKRVHMGFKEPKNQLCHLCEKAFVSKVDLRRHLAAIHGEGEKESHKCEKCEKVFSSTGNLHNHIRDEIEFTSSIIFLKIKLFFQTEMRYQLFVIISQTTIMQYMGYFFDDSAINLQHHLRRIFRRLC